SWRAVANYFKNDEQRNAANCAITAIDSTNNIIFDQDGTTMGLLGVHNLIVVRTGDAVLVCHRHQAEKIKNLLGKLPPELQCPADDESDFSNRFWPRAYRHGNLRWVAIAGASP